jgi:hypothetical protein
MPRRPRTRSAGDTIQRPDSVGHVAGILCLPATRDLSPGAH